MRFLHQGQDALAEFYRRHTPRCPRGRHFLPCAPSACAGSPRKLEVDVRDLPWLAKSGDYLGEQNLGAAHGHQGFGPVSRAKLRLESRRLRSLHRSISWWGFQPFILGNTTQDLPRGYFLEDDATPSNHRVFLVPSGQHRVAVLAHMRFEEIPVTFLPHAPRVVKRSQVELWPGVLDQRFSKSNALAIFASYFRPIGDCLEPVQCEPNAIRGLSGDYPISMD